MTSAYSEAGNALRGVGDEQRLRPRRELAQHGRAARLGSAAHVREEERDRQLLDRHVGVVAVLTAGRVAPHRRDQLVVGPEPKAARRLSAELLRRGELHEHGHRVVHDGHGVAVRESALLRHGHGLRDEHRGGRPWGRHGRGVRVLRMLARGCFAALGACGTHDCFDSSSSFAAGTIRETQ